MKKIFLLIVVMVALVACGSDSTVEPLPSPTPEPTVIPTPTPEPVYETYYEQVPYEEVITVTRTEYLTYEADQYNEESKMKQAGTVFLDDNTISSTEKIITVYNACLEITNTDDIGGQFEIFFNDISDAVSSSLEKPTVEIASGETKAICCPSYEELGDWTYTVRPERKEVEYEKTVTKYREEQRTRLVE